MTKADIALRKLFYENLNAITQVCWRCPLFTICKFKMAGIVQDVYLTNPDHVLENMDCVVLKDALVKILNRYGDDDDVTWGQFRTIWKLHMCRTMLSYLFMTDGGYSSSPN